MESPIELTLSVLPAEGRIEAHDRDGELAGYIVYEEVDGGWDFLHTELTPDFHGKGVGPMMTTMAFDLARDRGLRIRPTCPFTAKFVAKHPELQPLVL